MNLKDNTKKWRLVYSNGEEYFLSEKEYAYFLGKVNIADNNGVEGKVRMSDGPLLSTRFQSIAVNPRWVDPVLFKKKEVFFMLRKDFLERRELGQKIEWKDYIKSRKDEVKKIVKDFKEKTNE